MLSLNSLNAAIPLAEIMDRSNQMLLPVPGTPLEQLVNATRSNTQFALPVNNKQGEFQPSTYDIEYIANKRSEAGVCEHDVVQDEIVDMAARAVRGHLVVIRNAVIPAIVELHDNVAKAMSALPVSRMLGMEVKIYDLPQPLKSPAIENLISKYEGVPHESPALRMKCPDIQMEDLCALMKTSAGGFDSEVDKWVAVEGDSFFLQLWEDVFQTKNNHFDKFSQAIDDREQGINRALAIFLIARKLYEDPVEGISMSLPSFKSLAAQFRDQAAAKIRRALGEWELVKRRQLLVKKVDDKCIIVNEVVYRPWIMEGKGDNDVLFGNLVKQTGYTTVEQLTENAGELKATWNRTAAASATGDRAARFLQLKELLFSEFRKSIHDLKGDVEGPDTAAQEREDVLLRFKTELAKLRDTDVESVEQFYPLCLKLVCRSRFYKVPDAENFICQMMKIEKDNPGITPREASTIATVDYIAGWVAEMFKVVAVGSAAARR